MFHSSIRLTHHTHIHPWPATCFLPDTVYFRTLFTSVFLTTPTSASGTSSHGRYTQQYPSIFSCLKSHYRSSWRYSEGPPNLSRRLAGEQQLVSIPSPRNERSSRKLLARISILESHLSLKGPIIFQLDIDCTVI